MLWQSMNFDRVCTCVNTARGPPRLEPNIFYSGYLNINFVWPLPPGSEAGDAQACCQLGRRGAGGKTGKYVVNLFIYISFGWTIKVHFVCPLPLSKVTNYCKVCTPADVQPFLPSFKNYQTSCFLVGSWFMVVIIPTKFLNVFPPSYPVFSCRATL